MDAIERLRRRVEEYGRLGPTRRRYRGRSVQDQARTERPKLDLGLTPEMRALAQEFSLGTMHKLVPHEPSPHRPLLLVLVQDCLTAKEAVHRLVPRVGIDGARTVLEYEGIWFPNP